MEEPDSQQRADVRAAAARHVILLFALNSALFVPAYVLRNGQLAHLSAEVLLATSVLVLTARFRFARVLPWLFGGLYALLLSFLGYQFAFERAYETQPAIWEDSTMLVDLFYYLQDRWGSVAACGAIAGAVLAVSSVTLLSMRAFRALQSVSWSTSSRVVLFVLAAWSALSPFWFGLENDDAFMQVASKHVMRNVRVSIERRERVRAIATSAPDRRYDAFLNVKLERKPRVHLLMFEAYGERLASDPQMKAPYRELMRLMQERLSKRGLAMRSTFSDSPVFGGRSWLSIATVQTGIRIDQPSVYAQLEKVSSRITTFTEFFRAQGYRTLSLQPGNRTRAGLQNADLFRRDVMLSGTDLGYRGTPYNEWGWIPDQYSLGYYREQVLSAEKGPVFSFFINVSTHHPWNQEPFVADWHQLNEPSAVVDVPFAEKPRSDGMNDGPSRRYFEAVVYDWRVLTDFIEAEASEDTVFFIVGDHQPLLASEGAQSTFTPVHVLSRDTAFVQQFEKYGFVDGLFAEPSTGGLRHEALFSLFATELVLHNGTPVDGVQYLPQGIGLSGLGAR